MEEAYPKELIARKLSASARVPVGGKPAVAAGRMRSREKLGHSRAQSACRHAPPLAPKFFVTFEARVVAFGMNHVGQR